METIFQYKLAFAGFALFTLAFVTIRLNKIRREALKKRQQSLGKEHQKDEITTGKTKPKKKEKKNKLPQNRQLLEQTKDQNTLKVEESKPQNKKAKKKPKKADTEKSAQVKTTKELQQSYAAYFYGVLSLRASNSICTIDAVAAKNSKVLISNSKNELVLFDLKRWKKDSTCQDRYYTSLDNNTASAVAIGTQYYYAALTFEKTIAYYEFKGGEGGVYFRQVKKFNRNIYKTDASSLYVPQSERYIVSSGTDADTVINIWSMEGERLNQINTYQIRHDDIKYGSNKILVRGWTSEVKLFQLHNDKEGNFSRLDKSYHLTHFEQATCSAIDNMGLHALTICKNDVIKLWKIGVLEANHPTQKTLDAYQLEINSPLCCAIHTLKDSNDRMKTIAVIADESGFIICDRELKVYERFEGVSVSNIYMIGSMKSIVVGTLNSGGKLTIWNITSLVERIPEYTV